MESKATIGIYKIVSPSGKFYVGMTIDSFENRWQNHRNELKGNRHRCPGLQHAANKYGIENLEFNVLESWPKAEYSEALRAHIALREQQWWDTLSLIGFPYNGRPTGTGSVFHLQSSKDKISASVLKNFANRHNIDEASVLRNEVGAAVLEKTCRNTACSKRFTGEVRRTYCSRSCAARNKSRTVGITAETLYKLYTVQELSIEEICQHLKLKKSSVYGLLMKFDIPTRKSPKLNKKRTVGI